jgi:hypothetical protein
VVTPYPGRLEKDVGQLLSPLILRLYRRVAGKLMWLVFERPDLMYQTKELCRKLSNAAEADLAALKRMVRFVAPTRDRILRLCVDEKFRQNHRSSQVAVQVVSDANWASTGDFRSTSGGSVWIEGFLIACWSKTQPTVSQSTCEAELLANNLAAREGLFIKSILKELNFVVDLQIFTDSSSALNVTARRGAGRLRHLVVKELWLQQAVRSKLLRVLFTPGAMNVSDMFTKPLPRPRYAELSSPVGLSDLEATSAETGD